MTVPASAALLGLAWFAAVNAALSLGCWVVARAIARRPGRGARRTWLLLGIRLLPAAGSALVAAALFVPAHVRFEPANADEQFGYAAYVLAIAAMVILGRAGVRVGSIVITSIHFAVATRRYTVLDRGVRCVHLPLLGGIALAGVFRPRVLVDAAVHQVLTPSELDVAIAHEVAHRRAHDNLTRVLMACAPDFLGLTGMARRLEQLWEEEAECLADARAAAGDPRRAERLAAALLKVARLSDGRRAAYVSAWSMFNRPGLLERRVRLLVEGPASPGGVAGSLNILLVAIAIAVTMAWTAGVPGQLHEVTETLIARLP